MKTDEIHQLLVKKGFERKASGAHQQPAAAQ